MDDFSSIFGESYFSPVPEPPMLSDEQLSLLDPPAVYINASNAERRKDKAIGVQLNVWLDRACKHTVIINYEGRIEYADWGKKWWYGETFGTVLFVPGEQSKNINLIQVNPAPPTQFAATAIKEHQLYVVQITSAQGAVLAQTLGSAIIKERVPPLFILHGPGVNGTYALEANPDVNLTGVGDKVAEKGTWRLYEYDLPEDAKEFKNAVCTTVPKKGSSNEKQDCVVMLRRDKKPGKESTWHYAVADGEKLPYDYIESVAAAWFAGEDFYALYQVDSETYKVGLLSAGGGGEEFKTRDSATDLVVGNQLSADGTKLTFKGWGYSWDESYSNGGYVDVLSGTVTFGPADSDPSSGSTGKTTGLESKTTDEIVTWMYEFLKKKGWVMADEENQTILDVMKVTRAKDAPTNETYMSARLTRGTDPDPRKSFQAALDAVVKEFGINFKGVAQCSAPGVTGNPACEAANVNPGPSGIAQLMSTVGMGAAMYFPIIKPFTRTTTTTLESVLENTTNGYVQFSRNGDQKLLTEVITESGTTVATTQYPWGTSVGSGESSYMFSQKAKAGDTLLIDSFFDGYWTTTDTWTYLYPFNAYDLKHDSHEGGGPGG